MISNQILKETISGMKEVTGIDLCILDLSGRIVVTTMEVQESLTEHATEFAESMAEIFLPRFRETGGQHHGEL